LEFPDYDGFGLIEEIERRRIGIPIIFVTASCDEDSHIYARGSGAYECLRKSDGEEKVLQIVRKAMSEKNGFLKNDAIKEPQAAILLVDDDAASRKAIRKLLKPHGYTIFDAANGTEALQALSECSPDLIISEVMLPDLSGVDLIKRIRSRGIETEIIFVTDSGNWESNVDLMNVGAFDYIDKAIDEDRILSVVSQALEEDPTKFPVWRS
jgi:DNA-binding NtrC family response regulator